MPILPRYLLRQFLPVFATALILFLGLFLMKEFLRLFSLAMMKGIPVWWILSCFARLLPSFAALAAPMAFLVAAMVVLGQLAESGEIMALRASGFSYREITRPFLWIAAALSLLLLVINHKTGPEGFRSFKKRTSEAAQKVARIEIRPRSFTEFGQWRLYARGVGADGELEGVYLVKPGQSQGIRLNAEKGALRTEPGVGVELVLENGQLQLPSDDPNRFTTGRFDRYAVFVPLAGQALQPRELTMQEMSTPRLLERARDPGTKEDRRLEYRAEASVRTAGALSPLVFFWVGVPLGIGLKRRARGADFALSLLVMFAFYGLLVVGVSLGRQSPMLASAAPWLGDAAGLVAGAWLTRKAASQ